MQFKDMPIQKKLLRSVILISVVVLLVTCTTFFAYELYSFRQRTLEKISTLGKIISTNSTAALAFDNHKDATEILAALKAETHIVAAGLYDKNGKLFSQYPASLNSNAFPLKPKLEGYSFTYAHLEEFQTVKQGDILLGTLYLKYDLGSMYERIRVYGIVTALVMSVSILLAYLLSRILQKAISQPILTLAKTAKIISDHGDYSVRAIKLGNDELGSLTDAFNQMLMQIHDQNQALSEFNQNLEQKVKDRTIELEVANKELESFSYSVSHDLRAPIRAINGYANIVLEDYAGQFDGEYKRLINIILDNSRKMGSLIDDLLAFSKLGKKELKKTNFSMKEIVVSVWEDLYKMEANRNVNFVLKELPETYAERGTIQQVWVNLISNALKYTRHREKTVIKISCEEKKNVIIFYISDNGTGFDMEYYNKLFGVFQRLHSQEEFEGTGVGLAIAKRIVEKHGGEIWADSKLGKGTIFYFSLPKNSVSQSLNNN